jgi:hypothetical protein
MECCWRASLMYNYENNKLVLKPQKRNMPKCRLFSNFNGSKIRWSAGCNPMIYVSENLYK